MEGVAGVKVRGGGCSGMSFDGASKCQSSSPTEPLVDPLLGKNSCDFWKMLRGGC